jgi:hypothetical protein
MLDVAYPEGFGSDFFTLSQARKIKNTYIITSKKNRTKYNGKSVFL